MKERNVRLDILRLLAVVMIVANHSPLPSERANGAMLLALSYLTVPGIGLFFMISGALLLPIKGHISVFLRRRFTKILFPTLFWSLFYLLVDVWLNGTEVHWGRVLLSLPFSAQGNPALWFLYTLLGLYLLAPILSRWLNAASQREMIFYIALWAISLCYPVLSYAVNINTSKTGILYYFTGFVGYFILGYYMHRYPKTFLMKWTVPAFGIAIIVPVFCRFQGMKVDFYDLFWYYSIFVAIQCVFWWKLVHLLNIKCKSCSLLVMLSNLSFGVYLLHIFVMRSLLWHWSPILCIGNHALQTFTIAVLTFLLSVLISYALSFLPGAQYIIGFKRR